MNGFTVVDLPAGEPAWAQALPVLRELRPTATEESVGRLLALDDPQGVRFFGVFRAGTCLGVAGYRIVRNTSNGTKLTVDDLVTASAHRSAGVGTRMLAELRRRADLAACAVLDLDSGVQRHDAHRFYLRERMDITAHHFGLRLSGSR